MLAKLFRIKKIDDILRDADAGKHKLKRVLGAFDLTLLGIGAIIGAGIFATVGTAAAGDAQRLGAGPALILSFVLTGAACGFCALCYAEFASLVPISGSAYTYAYSTLGELLAWIIGWDLIIEYAVGNIAVAISWSGYFCKLLEGLGMELPKWITTDLRTALGNPDILNSAPHVFGVPVVMNLPAALIVAAITVVLVVGIKESARFNAVMVGIKLLILAFFIIVGAFYVKPANWTPFAPNGWAGIHTGAAVVFFAYIGFDAISTVSEETKNPSRDMPLGILGSLAICTLVYVAVAAVVTGMCPWNELNTAEPLTVAMQRSNLNWAAGIVSFGSVVAHTAVLLVFQLGQPRIFFSMARDGLLPARFAAVHPRFKTPHVTTILTGIFVAVFAAFASIDEMVDLTNIGTLFAFILVCAGIMILRRKDPARPRGFKCPASPLVPILGILCCFYLSTGLPAVTWWRFGVWLLIGLCIYFMYGFRKSKIGARSNS